MKGTKRASSLAKLSPKKSLTALAIGAALAVCTPQAIAADAFNGQVKGVIVDSQNNALSGTKITLVHKEKNITRTIVTNANGEYDVRRLPIGEYRVTIEKPGYEGYEESNLLVKLGSPIVFNGQIVQAGIDIERISVVGSSFAQIDLASSTGGIVVTAGELEKLPVNERKDSLILLFFFRAHRLLNSIENIYNERMEFGQYNILNVLWASFVVSYVLTPNNTLCPTRDLSA